MSHMASNSSEQGQQEKEHVQTVGSRSKQLQQQSSR